MKEVKEEIKRNLENEYNCIPVKFGRFTKYYPGIMKGIHTAITGDPKSGKSKFQTFFFVINALEEVKKVNDPNKLDIKILLFLLKTSKKVYKAKLLSAFLKRDYDLDIDYLQLMSIVSKKDRLMTDEIVRLIDKYDEWFEYFDSKVILSDHKKKASEIFKTCKDYLRDEVGSLGVDTEGSPIFSYNNPNLFVLVMTDSVNNFSVEADQSTGATMDIKRCIEKHVLTNMMELKTLYNCSIVDIHDMAVQIERIKGDFSNKTNEMKLEPTAEGLGESKVVGRTYDIILGIYNPSEYEFTDHKNYNIARLGVNYRSLKLVTNALGKNNVYWGMWFDGGAGTFDELPRSSELKEQIKLDKFLATKVVKKPNGNK